jgi:hypothetical protein
LQQKPFALTKKPAELMNFSRTGMSMAVTLNFCEKTSGLSKKI